MTDQGICEVARAHGRTRRSDRGQQTRTQILDAAEMLFAHRGFHGVALQDITRRAEVENALASYHFKTKEQLFTSVVQRRAEEHRRDLVNSLEAAIREALPVQPSNQDLVKAYARPALRKIERNEGWAAYIKLIVGIQNLDRSDSVSILTNSIFDETIKMFIDAFVVANPDVPKRSVHFALYFLHGTLIHVLSQGRTFDRLIDQERGFREPEEMLEELAMHFAGGLNPRARQTRR